MYIYISYIYLDISKGGSKLTLCSCVCKSHFLLGPNLIPAKSPRSSAESMCSRVKWPYVDPRICKKLLKCPFLNTCRYSANTFYCIDTMGTLAGCANDCPGVDPAAIIVGGGLVTAASAVAGTFGILNALPLLVGAGAGVGALGLGTTRAMCVSPWCVARSGQCCLLVGIGQRRRPRCPRLC